MYAVIETGGKQYRVQPGDIIQIEKLEGEVGAATKFSNVLLVAKPSSDATQIWLGKPNLSGAAVDAEIVGQGRGEKILIVKMKRRKQYRRTQGHRQEQTQIIVTSVSNGSEKAELSSADKKTKIDQFVSLLTPKGLAFTPKTLGSQSKNWAKVVAAQGAGKSAAKKSTAKKAEKTE